MDDAGERLAERCFLEAQVVREPVDVALGDDDVGREPAVDTGADEIMLASTVYDSAARRRSLELLAKAAG